MEMGIVYTIIVILAYILILVALKLKGVFKKETFSLWGPFLMWRTEKGKKLIERLAQKKRLWQVYGSISIGICVFTMILMMFFLIWAATLVPSIPKDRAPSPELMIGIPGVNPIIPVWYGIIALAVAIVVHEFAHGILTRVANLTVKSLGIIACIIPIGAFVEPDEEELKTTTKKKRMRLFAVGPATNILFAILCAVLFSWVFMASVSPVSDGVLLGGALRDSPGYDSGMNRMWMEITEINGTQITTNDDFQNVSAPEPLQNITVTYLYRGKFNTVDVISGVVVIHVSEDYPADLAGIKEGMIFSEVNGTQIRNDKDFRDAMKLTWADQYINMSLYEYNETISSYILFHTNATLEDKYEYYDKYYPSYMNDEEFKNKGFLGVSHSYLGLEVGGNPKVLSDRLSRPFSDVDSMDEGMFNLATYILLPFQRISPFPEAMTELYEVNGPLSVLPPEIFWPLANIFYWLFWLNIMVGMTNALPAVPLDGGHIFRDGLDGIITKVRKRLSDKDRERYVNTISFLLALTVLFLFIWQLLGPRI